MIKDSQTWDNWEKKYKKNPADIEANFRILAAMFEEAKALHVFPLLNPLEDIETKIYLAKAVNVSKAA